MTHTCHSGISQLHHSEYLPHARPHPNLSLSSQVGVSAPSLKRFYQPGSVAVDSNSAPVYSISAKNYPYGENFANKGRFTQHRFFLSHRDSTFTEVINDFTTNLRLEPAPTFAKFPAFADLDRDGYLDFVTADNSGKDS